MSDTLREPQSEEQGLETYFLYRTQPLLASPRSRRLLTYRRTSLRTVHGTRPLLLNRMTYRPGHFFKASMLDSQLATLEPPNPEGEANVAVIRLGQGEGEELERGMQPVCDEASEVARGWVG